MPQRLNVVCCYSCRMYQVHIFKKAKKWECKVCGEKQSFAKIFFEGSGRDCRLAVQNLNFAKSNEPPEPEQNYNNYSSNTSEEFFIESDLSSPQRIETDFPRNNTFSNHNLFPLSDNCNDYSNACDVRESLENEFLEKEFESNYLDISKLPSKNPLQKYIDLKNKNSEREIGNEDKENISNTPEPKKRYIEQDGDDFSVPSKKVKKETTFDDLIDESDSDSSTKSETMKFTPNSSMFESNCDIDFSLDF